MENRNTCQDITNTIQQEHKSQPPKLFLEIKDNAFVVEQSENSVQRLAALINFTKLNTGMPLALSRLI